MGGLKVKAKGGLKLKAKAKKMRRLQTKTNNGISKDGFLPDPTPSKKDAKKADTKKADDKKTDAKETAITSGKGGLDTTKYAKDVNVPELKGDSDQTAPKSSNLIKFAFMLFAALMTFF